MKPLDCNYSDENLMAMLRSGDVVQEHLATDCIYARHCHVVQQQLRRDGCSPDDAADAFQHALEAFWMQLSRPDFVIRERLGGWLLTVARRHWLNQLGRQQHFDKVATAWQLEYIVVNDADDAPQLESLLREILGRLDTQCRRLLELRFLDGLDRQNLASEMGYGNVESVSNRTNTCRDRAKQVAVSLGYRFL